MDEHSNVFNVAIGGGDNKKCILSRLFQMIDKWVVNVLKEETMLFSAQTNVMGFILLLPLIYFSHLANQSLVTGFIAKEVAKNKNKIQRHITLFYLHSEDYLGIKALFMCRIKLLLKINPIYLNAQTNGY